MRAETMNRPRNVSAGQLSAADWRINEEPDMRFMKATGRMPVVSVLAVGLILAAAAPAVAVAPTGPTVGRVVRVSYGSACMGQNAEIETAIDPATGFLYEEWIGCGGIGFAKSTDGGRTFSQGFELPGSGGGWDPAVVVGPTGSVYAAFMVSRGTSSNQRSYPVVDISTDHGRTFPTVSLLGSPRKNNWGDRDFIAVGPAGTIYVTWDYGPHNLAPQDFVCSPTGSCSFVAGDLNVVLQKSVNGGRTWSKIIPISPGFPASGADSAPILIEPSGRLDVLYQGYQVLNHRTLKLGVAHSYFTASADGGSTWSRPIRVGPARLSMNTTEWWIDGSLGLDSAGNLYATWDTQSGGHDIGWLAYSTTHGRTWSPLLRVTGAINNVTHIVQVLGGGPGIAYVAWLTDSSLRGYTQYLKVFSIGKGWLSRTIRVSAGYGNRAVWPGDTIGMSLYPGGAYGSHQLAISWGSALGGRKSDSQIWAAVLSHLP